MLITILNLIKKYRLIIVFSFIIIGSSIVGFFIDKERQEKETVVPIGVTEGETSEGIKPGKTTVSDIEKMENLREIKHNSDGTSTYIFGIETDPKPMEVVVKGNLVSLVKKRPTQGEPAFLKEIIIEYDEPDFTLYHQIIDSIAYIYLDEGLVIIADKDTGVIHELRYFTPSTKEEFLATWGKDLSDEQPTPPPLYY